MKTTKRHLRPELTIALVIVTVLSAIYCVGTESTSLCMVSLVSFIFGTVVLSKYGGE